MPAWRRHEYREALKAYAAKYGQPITNAQAAHDIDKAVAMGDLDAAGPVLRIKRIPRRDYRGRHGDW